MQFFETQKAIKRVGPQKYVIGQNPLQPQLSLDGETLQVKNIQAATGLFISGINFIEYITGDISIGGNFENQFYSHRHNLTEAFEEDENGDLMPSEAQGVSDPIWILKNENDLELRANHWRRNEGNESFTEDVSIGIYEEDYLENGKFNSLKFGSHPIPTGINASGEIGQVSYSKDSLYLCVGENEWKRMLLVDFE